MATQQKIYAFEEVSKHNHKNDCWLIMFGKVYDVTPFMDDHPGGDDVIISSATGKDATNDFEDVGHSKTARDMPDKYYIGQIDPSSIKATNSYIPPQKKAVNDDSNNSSFLMKLLQLLVPVMILGLAIVVRNFIKPD